MKEGGIAPTDTRVHVPGSYWPNPWPLDHPGTTDRLKGVYGVADATALRAALDPAGATRKHGAYQG
jgi:hypothetical protein